MGREQPEGSTPRGFDQRSEFLQCVHPDAALAGAIEVRRDVEDALPWVVEGGTGVEGHGIVHPELGRHGVERSAEGHRGRGEHGCALVEEASPDEASDVKGGGEKPLGHARTIVPVGRREPYDEAISAREDAVRDVDDLRQRPGGDLRRSGVLLLAGLDPSERLPGGFPSRRERGG